MDEEFIYISFSRDTQFLARASSRIADLNLEAAIRFPLSFADRINDSHGFLVTTCLVCSSMDKEVS